ncbi:hypothetical protein [Mucilaginibacter sp. dw_454]|uniref:hypothetical protein n=1 Tax=Mucilaginibacter sp. dw_454 TaxID=2720079 RepID=UPI001BD25551|nr:hypothetical protein [Mucilaginibacter sp. dw_454]
MDKILDKAVPEVRLRAFRAIDEPKTCALFVEGHANVLSSIGIKKVTSSQNGWTTNPAVFVIIVESMDGKRVFGGARVHVSGGSEPLPIEQAVSLLDPSIHKLVWEYSHNGTGEVCGLWNSSELSGYGIGTPLLIRSGIAIAAQLGIQTLFALCAPYTVQPVVNCGMELVSSIGNKGTFYYPKLDLIATAMVLNDLENLSRARDEDRAEIMQMRNHPDELTINELKQKKITVYFALGIPNLNKWNLSEFIEAANQDFLQTSVNERDINFL